MIASQAGTGDGAVAARHPQPPAAGACAAPEDVAEGATDAAGGEVGADFGGSAAR